MSFPSVMLYISGMFVEMQWAHRVFYAQAVIVPRGALEVDAMRLCLGQPQDLCQAQAMPDQASTVSDRRLEQVYRVPPLMD